jgi:hypothetical protein
MSLKLAWDWGWEKVTETSISKNKIETKGLGARGVAPVVECPQAQTKLQQKDKFLWGWGEKLRMGTNRGSSRQGKRQGYVAEGGAALFRQYWV